MFKRSKGDEAGDRAVRRGRLSRRALVMASAASAAAIGTAVAGAMTAGVALAFLGLAGVIAAVSYHDAQPSTEGALLPPVSATGPVVIDAPRASDALSGGDRTSEVA